MLLYSFKCLLEIIHTQLGKNSCGGTPGPIPNPEVKPVNAESTWREASREDRNLPSFFYFLEINFLKIFSIIVILNSNFYKLNKKKETFYLKFINITTVIILNSSEVMI